MFSARTTCGQPASNNPERAAGGCRPRGRGVCLALAVALFASAGWPGPASPAPLRLAAAPRVPPRGESPQRQVPGEVHVPGEVRVPGEVIVKLRASAALDACVGCAGEGLETLFARHRVREALPLFTTSTAVTGPRALRAAARARRAPARTRVPELERTFLLRLGAGASVAQAVAELAREPIVEYAEPNLIASAQWVPNDPYLLTSGAWGQSFRDLWGLDRIGMERAWDLSRGRSAGGTPIVVAVVDSGVDPTHPDLAANLWRNPGEIPGNGTDDDGNGHVDDVGGWDFVTCEAFGCGCGEPKPADASPADPHGHGTHVAGTIAAVGDNGLGVIGVAPGAVVMPVRALNRFGEGSVAELAAAIHYAVANGADVINASFGGLGTSRTLAEAVAEAIARGVVVVAAAGNHYGRDVLRFTPGGLPGVITVAASNPAEDPFDFGSGFSCRGAELDVAAPGIDVLSLRAAGTDLYGDGTHVVDEDLYRASGTSMAAPHVSGVVANLLAVRPELDVEAVRQLLRATAVDFGDAGWDVLTGAGRLDALAPLSAAPGPRVELATPAMGELLLNRTTVELRGSAEGAGFAAYEIRARRIDLQGWTTVVPPTTTAVVAGTLGSWNVATLPAGVYHLELRATNAAGGVSSVVREALVLRDATVKPGWPRPLADQLRDGSPVVGDLDGDGRDEIVASSLFSVFAYRSDGTLLWQRAFDGFVGGPALGDLDGDGRPEVVFEEVGCAGARLHVLAGNGGPRWTRQVPITTGFRSYPALAATLGDVDGNGTLEILLPHPNDKLFVYSGSGALLQRLLDNSDGPVAFADLDGDRAPEVLAATVLPTGGRYLHRLVYRRSARQLVASAGWPVRVMPPSDPYSFGVSMRGPIAVDLDGDRRREVVLSVSGKLHALRANGKPLPGWPKTLPRIDDQGFLAAGDLDGDRRPEIALGTWASGILVVRGNGQLTSVPMPFGDAFQASPVIADLDGDGRSELILNGTRATWHGGSNGVAHVVAVRWDPAQRTFVRGWTRSTPLVSGFEDVQFGAPVIGDFDRNGKLDLFVGAAFYNGSQLMAWELPAGSAAKAPAWAMFGRDARHTNAF